MIRTVQFLRNFTKQASSTEKEIYSYITEGIGEDILPENVDFSLIDHFEKVTDKDGVIMTRRLAREEGFFMGNSAGSASSRINAVERSINKR